MRNLEQAKVVAGVKPRSKNHTIHLFKKAKNDLAPLAEKSLKWLVQHCPEVCSSRAASLISLLPSNKNKRDASGDTSKTAFLLSALGCLGKYIGTRSTYDDDGGPARSGEKRLSDTVLTVCQDGMKGGTSLQGKVLVHAMQTCGKRHTYGYPYNNRYMRK